MIDLRHGDCLEVLPTLPAGSVDCVLTDPPYPCIKRSYGYWTEAEWFAMMRVVVPECMRILKPTGSAVFILQPNSERVGRMRTWLWEFMLWVGKEWGIVQDVCWWNYQAQPTVHTHRETGLTRPSIKMCVWVGPSECHRNQTEILWQESDSNRASRESGRCTMKLQRRPSGYTCRDMRQCSVAIERGGVTPFNLLPIAGGGSVDTAGAHGHGAGTPSALCDWWLRYICPPCRSVLECVQCGHETTEENLSRVQGKVSTKRRSTAVLLNAMPTNDESACATNQVATATVSDVPEDVQTSGRKESVLLSEVPGGSAEKRGHSVLGLRQNVPSSGADTQAMLSGVRPCCGENDSGNSLQGMRQDVSPGSSKKRVLFNQMRCSGDGEKQEETGRSEDFSRLCPDTDAESPDGKSRRVCDGASTYHGSTIGKDVGPRRSSASQKLDKGRQQNRESRTSDEERTRQTSQASRRRMSVLQGETSAVKCCPKCGSSTLVAVERPAGIVLDPFSGSGTVALAALKQGKSAIGIERIEEYHQIAQRRIAAEQAKGGLFAEN